MVDQPNLSLAWAVSAPAVLPVNNFNFLLDSSLAYATGRAY